MKILTSFNNNMIFVDSNKIYQYLLTINASGYNDIKEAI